MSIFFGNHNFDEIIFAKLMSTDTHVGTSPSNIVKFLREIGWNFQNSLDNPSFEISNDFQKFVIKNLSEGKPILVEKVEFDGHWGVIIGIDTIGTGNILYDNILIIEDSYDTSDHKKDGYD